MVIFWIVSSVVLFATSQGEPLLCQGDSTASADGLTCECRDSSLFYSASNGKCLSTCAYYGNNVCGYSSGQICVDDSTSSEGFTCGCDYGYVLNGIICIDADLCAPPPTVTCSVTQHEICVSEGADACGCASGYYRESNGICTAIDVCSNSERNDCEHFCIKTGDGMDNYTCTCAEGYILTGSTKCQINTPGYEECECGSQPEFAICAITADGNKTCEPKQGFQLLSGSDEEMEDIDECSNDTYQCPRNSECINEIGSYTCRCFNGYTRNAQLMECVETPCSEEGLIPVDGICTDPCGPEVGFWCPANTVCTIDDSKHPLCQCQLNCQEIGRTTNSTFSIYHVSFDIPTLNVRKQQASTVTKSMEHIFGLGNAEIFMYSEDIELNTITVVIDIGVVMPVDNTSTLQTIIEDACYPLINDDTKCLLPGGTIINTDSLTVEEKYPCEENLNLCSSINAECQDNSNNMTGFMPGSFQCLCMDGYDLIDTYYGMYCSDINECESEDTCPKGNSTCVNTPGSFYCLDYEEYQYNLTELQREIDQLNSDLSDQQRKTSVVGGVLGALLGLALIAIIVGIIYLHKMRETV